MNDKIKVIIADSEEDLCNRLLNYFNKNSIIQVIKICNDGFSTLKAVKSLQPDMLILDLILPGADGIEVLKGIQEIKDRPNVIVTSVLENSQMIHCACALGADYYICKPYALDSMLERILQIESNTYVMKSAEYSQKTNQALKKLEGSSLEVKVTSAIRRLGIPAHIKGYQYTREAVILSISDDNMLTYITKCLYPTIAKAHNTTSSSVERAIRHAICVAWERGNLKKLGEFYGYGFSSEQTRPTNSEFISLLVDHFRLEMQNENIFKSKSDDSSIHNNMDDYYFAM